MKKGSWIILSDDGLELDSKWVMSETLPEESNTSNMFTVIGQDCTYLE